MTSKDRHEARYQRRKARRTAARRAREEPFEEVFSYGRMYESYKKCRRGVSWKASVQKYISRAPLEVLREYERLRAGTFKTDGFYEFDLYERGKKRHIQSVTMRERIVQRCLCDYSLTPMIGRSFIYDNGASLEKKGCHFTMRRLVRHLQWHYRKYGTEGYVLLFDFKHFFESVSHDMIRRILSEAYTDKRTLDLIMHFVDAFGEKGMGLGSQISQILALLSANRLDHVIKEELGIRCYGRYMDDGCLIHPDKGYLETCLARIREVCRESGIELNEKKTRIVKMSRGFTWLKARIRLTGSGKIVMKIYRRSVTKMRQKLKAYKRRLAAGLMTLEDVRTSVQCWISYALHFDACRTVENMVRLIFRLFGRQDGYAILRTGRPARNSIRRKRKYIKRVVEREYALAA